MLKNSSHTKLHWRAVCVALLLALVMGSAGQSARAAPAAAWETYVIASNVPSSLRVCVGEKKLIQVSIKKIVYRLFGGIGGSTTYPTYQLIGAEGNNAEVGSINSSGMTGGDPTLARPAIFTFTASKKGTVTIKFSDHGPFSSGAPARSRASDLEITIEVKECDYHLVAFSQWWLTWGFKPHVLAVVDTLLQPDQNGFIPPVYASVEHVANSQPFGICSTGATVNKSEVKISGRVDRTDGKLYLTLDYGIATATTFIRCPSVYVPVVGESTGSGEALTLISSPLTVSMSAGGGGENYSHILESYRTVSGITSIVIQVIFR